MPRPTASKTAEKDDLAVCGSAGVPALDLHRDARATPRRSLRRSPGGAAASRHSLTRRELEILQLVAEGHSNSQLARMLWVTEQTVKFHLSNIYRKLSVSNRTEASRWAQFHGLLPATRPPLAESAV